MTIRLLSTYDGFAPQSIITLDSALETALIAGGNATATLTGGVVAYRERQPVMIQPAVQKRGSVNLSANRKAVVPLTEGSALTIAPAAGTTGTYQRYDASGAAVGALTTIGASTLVVGPFEGDFTVEIKCTTGSLAAKVASAGGGLYPVAFSSVVALDAQKAMPATYINTPTAFAPGATAPGGSNSVVLYADGVNAPTFTGFLQAGSSMGYDSSAVAKVNYVDFWNDGRNSWYSVSQPTPNTPDLTFPGIIPVLQAAATSRDGAQLILTYNLPLTANSPTPASFAPSGGKTVTAAAASGVNVILTLSAPYALGDTVTLSYTPGAVKIQGLNNNAPADSLTNRAVTNVVLLTTPLQFTLTGSVTESTNTPLAGQYTYNVTANGSFGANCGISARSLPANTAGRFTADIKSLAEANNIIIGLKASNASGSFNTFLGSISVNAAGVYSTTIGAGGGVSSGMAAMVGDIYGPNRDGAGNISVGFWRAADPTNFQPIRTLATANTVQLWAVFDSNTVGTKLVNPQASASFA